MVMVIDGPLSSAMLKECVAFGGKEWRSCAINDRKEEVSTRETRGKSRGGRIIFPSPSSGAPSLASMPHFASQYNVHGQCPLKASIIKLTCQCPFSQAWLSRHVGRVGVEMVWGWCCCNVAWASEPTTAAGRFWGGFQVFRDAEPERMHRCFPHTEIKVGTEGQKRPSEISRSEVLVFTFPPPFGDIFICGFSAPSRSQPTSFQLL